VEIPALGKLPIGKLDRALEGIEVSASQIGVID
jgi:hypothetical protein